MYLTNVAIGNASFVKSKMSKSCLSRKIDICNSISKLSKDGCFEVIRLLGDAAIVSGNSIKLHQLTTKMFMDCSNNWTSDQIIEFENKIKQTLSYENGNHCHSQSTSQQNNYKSIKLANTNKDIQFPLFRLPIDLITHSSFYLNEKDILNFEQCCRLFYQMINNTSYLKLSNNFKRFIINCKTLDQMSQRKYSFFKYSKAKYLKLDFHSELDLHNHKEDVEEYFKQLRSDWEKAKQVCITDGWFDTIFNSIETLDINDDGMMLLDKFPINLLFDSNESHLNEMILDHYWNRSIETYLAQYINKFEQEYLNIQRKFKQQQQQMRVLRMVKHDSLHARFDGPIRILAEGLQICSLTIDLNKNWLSSHYNPYLRKLTCKYDIRFTNVNIKINTSDKENMYMNIETLRLINFDQDSSYDICNNKILIEILNFEKSLKNLILHIHLTDMTNQQLNQCKNVIESILKKENLYTLQNVVILLHISRNDLDLIFKMLKTNIQLLKHQFKQLIVGLRWRIHDLDDWHYIVLEWNQQIDNKYLDQLKALGQQNNEELEQEIQHQMKEKYFSLLNNH